MTKKLLSSATLLVAIVLFMAVNIFSNSAFQSARLDMTANRLYTLTQGTRNILHNLQEPVTLRFYLSSKLANQLPGINTYAVRVRELLEEYQRAARGKMNLLVLDPEPFSEEEDRAVAFGLQGVPLDNNNTTFYFGLAGTNSTDKEEIIPFFQNAREEFLEYDLTKLVYQLSNPKKQVVGLLSSLPLRGAARTPMMASTGGEPWMVADMIEQTFEVRELEKEVTEIPSEINVLMLVHPKGLSDTTLYAIDQFVLRGGRVAAFVDPYSEVDTPTPDPKNPLAGMNAPRNSDLAKLLTAWGVELTSGQTAGDLLLAKKVQMQKGSRAVVITYPVWMDFGKEQFNADDIVTSQLETVALASPGILKKKDGAEIQFSPLLQTTDKAAAIATTKLGMMADPEAMVREFTPGGAQLAVAARISGKIKTAFPDGKPKPAEGEKDKDNDGDKAKEETPAEHLAESKEDANLIIVADTDLLEDKFWVRVQSFLGSRIAIPLASNGNFVTNALDSLAGSNDLISVRSRGSFTRPFTKVEQIQQQAQSQYQEKEKELLARLQETENKIRELQSQKSEGGAMLLSAQQQAEIENFRNKKVEIRKELRNVQHELRKNIEKLEARMKFINIGLMPLLVGLGGILLGVYGSRRKRYGKVPV